MKKVFIYAYLAQNLGDDLMVRILCERYPHIKFKIYATKEYRKIFRDIPNLKICSWEDRKAKIGDSFWKRVRNTENGYWKMLIKLSDGVVHVGGSSFTQHYDNFEELVQADEKLRNLSKKLYVLGVNFGPYSDENYYERYSRLFAKYDGVTFRDQFSYNLFSCLKNVRWAPDIVFNYPVKRGKYKEKKQILFSVIELERRNGKYALNQWCEAYERFIAKMAEVAMEQGYQVMFVGFCEMQGDMDAIENIKGRICEKKRKDIQVYCYTGDLEACMRLFEESEKIVGTRFHSIILGWLFQKKVLPIVYDDKTRNLLEDNKYRTFLEFENLALADPREMFNKMESLPQTELQILVQEAERQFWAVDKFLGKSREKEGAADGNTIN